MNQDKDEYEVGIPLDDLSSEEKPLDTESSQDAPPVEDAPEPDSAGLPALFDEDELAEVGLKASPFDDGELADDGIHASPFDDGDQPEEGDDEGPLSQADQDDEEAPAGVMEQPDTEDVIDDGIDTPDIHDEFADKDDMDATSPQAEAPPEIMTDAAILQDAVPHDFQPQFDAIQAQLTQLLDEFKGKIKYDAHKDEIIDKLHQELQEYKQDIVKKHILSIVLDVVKVADDIRKWLAYFRSLEVSQRDPVKLFRYLEGIPSELEDIFYWQGVKPYTNREGDFDPARQRAIKKITTDDISKDKTIAKSLRPGYEWEGKVIRQEMVAVYVYTDEKQSVDMGNIDE